MPSHDVVNLAITNKNGENAGKHSLTLPKSDKTDKAIKFSKYKDDNGFNLLKHFK